MATETVASGGGGGEESVPSSPRHRVKFLCSHGGKILPRPGDGVLKYVGGETRVVAVPRDITFSELMKRMSTLFDGEMVLKYQLTPEDLDALVSVRTDEDVKHMFDEYDRHESEGSPKLRSFLFPSAPVVLENQIAPVEPHAIEQRYIDAINGVDRRATNWRLTPINSKRPFFSISAGSSPKSTSPDGRTADSTPPEPNFSNGYHSSWLPMHKVQSSPCLCSINNNLPPHTNFHFHQPQQHYYYHQNHQQQLPSYGGCQACRSPISIGPLPDIPRGSFGHGHGLYSPGRLNLANGGGSQRCGSNEFESFVYGSGRRDRADSVPMSPRKHMWE